MTTNQIFNVLAKYGIEPENITKNEKGFTYEIMWGDKRDHLRSVAIIKKLFKEVDTICELERLDECEGCYTAKYQIIVRI